MQFEQVADMQLRSAFFALHRARRTRCTDCRCAASASAAAAPCVCLRVRASSLQLS